VKKWLKTFLVAKLLIGSEKLSRVKKIPSFLQDASRCRIADFGTKFTSGWSVEKRLFAVTLQLLQACCAFILKNVAEFCIFSGFTLSFLISYEFLII